MQRRDDSCATSQEHYINAEIYMLAQRAHRQHMKHLV